MAAEKANRTRDLPNFATNPVTERPNDRLPIAPTFSLSHSRRRISASSREISMLQRLLSVLLLKSPRSIRRSECLSRTRIIVSILCFLMLGPSASSICTAYNYTANEFTLGTIVNGSATVSGFGLSLNVSAVWPDSGAASKGVGFAFTGPEYPTDMYWAWNFSGGNSYTASISPGVGATCFPGGGICPTSTITHGSYHLSGGISAITITGQLYSFGPASGSIMVALGGGVGGVCSGGTASSGLKGHCDFEDEKEDEGLFCQIFGCSEEEFQDPDNPQIAGANLLAVPVVQEHGFTDYVFAQAEQQPPNPTLMIGDPTYVFGSSDIPFSRFGIPDSLPNGDHEFRIMFDGMSFPLQANQEFVFTDYVPSGVMKFFLTDFDPAEMLDRTAAPTFTHAFQFGAEGATYVAVGAIAPGNYDLTGRVDAADYEIWKSTFGSITDLRADGNQDGIVNAADYTFWRNRLGAGLPPSPGIGSQAGVPEPMTAAMLAAGFILCGITLRRQAETNLSPRELSLMRRH